MLNKDFIFPEEVGFEGWLSSTEGRFLYELAQLNPHLGVVVELGCFSGRSTICLAQGSKKVGGGKVFAVDTFLGGRSIGPHPDFYHQFRQNIKRYHLLNDVFPIRENTVEAAHHWQKPIRLLFHDASHFYEDVVNDFNAWEKHIVPGGIIAFHDSINWPGVNKLVTRLIKSGNFKDFRTLRNPWFKGLTWAVKMSKRESMPKPERCRALLWFKLISLPMVYARFRQMVKERGEADETDIWYRFFGRIANFWKNLTGKM